MISYKKLLYFDIETAAEYKSWSDFVINDKEGSESFKLKYDRAKNNNNPRWLGDIEDVYINNAPLLAEYGIIICISYGLYNNGVFKTITQSIKNTTEKELIQNISNMFIKSDNHDLKLCGHNIKEFDIPFIFKKMLKYSIKIPNIINFVGKKPWEIDIYDTAIITKLSGSVATSLADLTHLLNIKSPKDDISGSDVHKVYWYDNDIEKIEDYCSKDIIAVKDVYLRLFECLGESY
jgi:hypothetical protein